MAVQVSPESQVLRVVGKARWMGECPCWVYTLLSILVRHISYNFLIML